MAGPATSGEFLELLRRSNVITPSERLDNYLRQLHESTKLPDPAKLAALLVQDGLLTNYQAEQIGQGKWRGFDIGKYRVLEKLGSGGMGNVFLCEHMLMRRRVAVKVLPTAKAVDSSAVERFHREARAVAALHHPNIVQIYDIDQHESLHYLVMEYVDGASLQDIVKKTGPMDVVRAAHYVRQAADALTHLHQAGLVHRDVKPGNILVNRKGMVKLLDMGLARFFTDKDDDLTKRYDENVLGTADYLAPEQALDSHSVDIRADLYSLGATFYFLLTARTLFGDGTVAQKLIWHQSRQPKAVSSYRQDIPAELTVVLERLLAKDPAQRFQTPDELAAALAPFVETPIAPPAEAEMPRLSRAASGTMASESSTIAGPGSSSGRSWQLATPPPSSKPPQTASPPPSTRTTAPPTSKPAKAPPARQTTPRPPGTKASSTPAATGQRGGKTKPAPAATTPASVVDDEDLASLESPVPDTKVNLAAQLNTPPQRPTRRTPAKEAEQSVLARLTQDRRLPILAAGGALLAAAGIGFVLAKLLF